MVESAAPSPGRIFISYRREETAYPAGWLYDRLADRYGAGQVFKDVDSIQLGADFVEVITAAVGSCDVLLVLVGDRWLTITDADGRRRLDDPEDFVRLEIEAALTRNVRVIPILVDAAGMPRADELPATLAGLVRRQALELSPARFNFDTSRLLKVLDRTLGEMHTAHLDAAAISAAAGKALDRNRSTLEQPTAPGRREQAERSQTPSVPPAAPAKPAKARPPPARNKLPDKRRRRLSRRVRMLVFTVVGCVVAIVLAIALWPTGSPEWRSIDPLSEPVDSPGVVVQDGELWVVGGLLPAAGQEEAGRAVDTVQIYDPSQDRWRAGPTLPLPLDHAAVTTDGHRVYVVGGQTDENGTKVVMDEVWMLDENDQTWTPLDPLPEPRAAGAAAWDGEHLVFAGGYAARSTGPASADVWVLDESRWHKLGHLQRARQHLAAATDGEGNVWFLGGRDGADRFGLVDIVTGDSITPGPQISPVGSPAAVWHPSRGVCLLGGLEPRPNQTPSAVTTNAVTCQETEPGTDPWPPLPEGRGGAGAAILGSDLYVVGGLGDAREGFKPTAGVQVLELG